MESLLEDIAKSLLSKQNEEVSLNSILDKLVKGEDLHDVMQQIKSCPLANILTGNCTSEAECGKNTTCDSQCKSKSACMDPLKFQSFKQSCNSQPQTSGNTYADIREMETCYIVYLDIPGVLPNAIDIEFHEGKLVVKAEKIPYSVGSDSFLQKERFIGIYEKKVKLPENIDINDMSAKYEYGVLSIRVPKPNPLALSKKKKIPVTSVKQ